MNPFARTLLITTICIWTVIIAVIVAGTHTGFVTAVAIVVALFLIGVRRLL